MTRMTENRLRALSRSCAITLGTGGHALDLDVFVGAEDRVFEGDDDVMVDVAPLTLLLVFDAEFFAEIGEDIPEDIAKGRKDLLDTLEPCSSRRRAPLETFMAEGVVGRPLMRIGEYGVSLLYSLEVAFGLFISWITIRMMFESEFAKCALYLLLTGVLRDEEHAVIVEFFHVDVFNP